MNITHRSIWNAALCAWVAVSESTRARGKRSGSVVALAASIACSSVGAQTVIENDDVVTVPGTHGSPWNLGGDLLLSNGTLTVESGGQVSNVRGYIGTFFGQTGNATVTGTGSTWTSSLILFVGNDGTGTLTVSNGGQVSSDRGYIAAGGGSTGNATVTGAGSTWTSTEAIYVGQSGTGTLTVSNGGAVRNTSTGFVGGNGSGVGNATVTGAGSIWASDGGLRIGLGGTGTLTVSDGGHVSSGGGVGLIELAVDPSSTGVLNIGAAVGSAAQAAGTIAGSEVRFGAGTASLNFNHTDTAYTFGTRITGAGTLNHYAGTTILTGTNTYSGGTTINGGTVSVSTDANLGNAAGGLVFGGGTLQMGGAVMSTRAITLNAGGGTVDTNGNNASLSGVISGSGAFTKTGAGTLSLTGTNSYQGGTTINGGTVAIFADANLGNAAGGLAFDGGTLQMGAAVTSARAITLNAGGGIVDTNGNNATLNGVMSGGGAFTKTGSGTLTLSGANTYSGGTTVNGGALRAGAVDTLSSSSAFTLANTAGATLDLNNFNQTIGSLSGGGATGGDITLGSGTLTTGGNNSSTSYGGVISGSGGVTKQGAGNLNLTGSNTYTGATTVSGGTLSVNGSITSPVTVNSGGAVGGSGTINGAVSIGSGGAFAPGNSIGTITVNGNVNFAAGSIYRVEVDAAGNADRINVTGAPGTATLNGGTVDVQAGAGSYQANTQYTILNATGGVTGTFNTVTSNLAFLTPTLSYDPNNVFLALARNDISFSTVAQTPNQIATSTALQNANAGATGDMSTVQTALTGLSAQQARAAYDSTSGAGLIALRDAGASFAAGFGSQLQARLRTVQGSASNALASALSSRPIQLAANSHTSDLPGLLNAMSDSPPQKFSLAGGASLPSASSSQGRGFWLRGSGGYQDTKSDGNAAASELRNSSISAGFDAELREGLVLGAALSSGTSRLGFDNTDTGKSRGSAVALYGSYAASAWTFKGSASAAWSSNHMDRAVTVGALSRTASADFDSNTLSAYGEATYSLPMNGWTLQPLAALSLSRNKADGFTETGAGALNLQVAGQTTTSTQSLLGAKASFEAGSLRLEPRAIWAHEFGDINTPMTAQFQGAATASPFQVSGVALKRDTLILGLGATGSISKNIDLFADVQTEHNSRQSKLAVLVGLRARW